MTSLLAARWTKGHPAVFYGMPDYANVEPIILHAHDGKQVRGLYWTPKNQPKPKTAVFAMHPRQDWSRHYTFPALIEAGIGCFGAVTRSPNNDIATIHEEIALDAEACVRFLKQDRGVEKVVLLGNGGGGSLLALYQAQARKPRRQRIARTPGGRPTAFNDFDMATGDGLIFLLCHKGEGRFMNEVIDPSVVDERNPLLSDRDLDLYDPRNGFRPSPHWSEYSDDFLRRFTEAQAARVARLDKQARALIEDSDEAEALLADPDFRKLPVEKQAYWQRRGALETVMTIYRTQARPAYVDRRIDPSARPYGSLISGRPDLMNMKFQGFGRLATAQAWLSTWSGHVSNADLHRNCALLTEPALVLHAGKSPEVYRLGDAHAAHKALKSTDKTLREFPESEHYFRALDGGGGSDTIEELMNTVVPWVKERFPV